MSCIKTVLIWTEIIFHRIHSLQLAFLLQALVLSSLSLFSGSEPIRTLGFVSWSHTLQSLKTIGSRTFFSLLSHLYSDSISLH